MALTKIILGKQSRVTEDVPFGMKNIKDLADPVDPQDAVTKSWVTTNAASSSGVIGSPEDGSYADGLFTDFQAVTPVGVAVDRFNEVLKSLSPQPAPSFSAASCNQTGVSGKLSFGPSNAVAGFTNVPSLDVNGSFTVSGVRLGIFNATTTFTGTLANNVTPGFTNSRPYPNLAFGDSDQGFLRLEVNGTVVHSVDLSTFAGGTTMTSGSGFTLLAATPVAFSNGDTFAVFKYRTGTWTVAPAAQRSGYNTVRIRHEYAAGMFRDSATFEFVVDAATTATTFSAETLTSLAMTGSRKISGVEYNTAGTAKYGVTINNAYKTTYSASGTPIAHSGTNATLAADALPAATNDNDVVTLANKTVTVSATRLLNGSIAMNSTVDRTVQSDLASTGVSIAGLFVENTADSSTNTSITFNGENRRINSSLDVNSTAYTATTSPAAWDSAQSLLSNTGLLVYNGQLVYPKLNFSTIANGPAGNVDYSGATGLRTFIGFFFDASARSNFRFNIAGSAISFVPVATGPSGNNLTLEVLAPNTTKNAGGAVVFKDAAVSHSGVDTDLGCYASTYGASIPTAWGCTLGTKNTSTAGNVIVVKITASAAWTGNISSIGITWL